MHKMCGRFQPDQFSSENGGKQECSMLRLGPDDRQMIISRIRSEVKEIEDDGVNYIQTLWIVPPDEVASVQSKLDEGQPFPERGR